MKTFMMCIGMLPEELMINIVSKLPVWDMNALQGVSRLWSEFLYQHDCLWADCFAQPNHLAIGESDAYHYCTSIPFMVPTGCRIKLGRILRFAVKYRMGKHEHTSRIWYTRTYQIQRVIYATYRNTRAHDIVLDIYKRGYYQLLTVRKEFFDNWHLFLNLLTMCTDRTIPPVLSTLPRAQKQKVFKSISVMFATLCHCKQQLKENMIEKLNIVCPELFVLGSFLVLMYQLLNLNIDDPQLGLLAAKKQIIYRLSRRILYIQKHASRVLEVLH